MTDGDPTEVTIRVMLAAGRARDVILQRTGWSLHDVREVALAAGYDFTPKDGIPYQTDRPKNKPRPTHPLDNLDDDRPAPFIPSPAPDLAAPIACPNCGRIENPCLCYVVGLDAVLDSIQEYSDAPPASATVPAPAPLPPATPSIDPERVAKAARMLELFGQDLATFGRRLADIVRVLTPDPDPICTRPGSQAAVRAWARANGYTVNDKGTIRADVRQAYAQAHPTPGD